MQCIVKILYNSWLRGSAITLNISWAYWKHGLLFSFWSKPIWFWRHTIIFIIRSIIIIIIIMHYFTINSFWSPKSPEIKLIMIVEDCRDHSNDDDDAQAVFVDYTGKQGLSDHTSGWTANNTLRRSTLNVNNYTLIKWKQTIHCDQAASYWRWTTQ